MLGVRPFTHQHGQDQKQASLSIQESQKRRLLSPPHEEYKKSYEDGIVLTSPISSPPPSEQAGQSELTEDSFTAQASERERSKSAPPDLEHQAKSSPFQVMVPERSTAASPRLPESPFAQPESLKSANEPDSESERESFKSAKSANDTESESESGSWSFKTALEPEPEPKLKSALKPKSSAPRPHTGQPPKVEFNPTVHKKPIPNEKEKDDDIWLQSYPRLLPYQGMLQAHRALSDWVTKVNGALSLQAEGYVLPAMKYQIGLAVKQYIDRDLRGTGNKMFKMLAQEAEQGGVLSPELTGWVCEVKEKLQNLQSTLAECEKLCKQHAVPQPQSLTGLVGWTQLYCTELDRLPLNPERVQSLQKDEQEHLQWERKQKLENAQSGGSTNNRDWKPEWYQKLESAQAYVDRLMTWMAGLDEPHKLPHDEELLISPERREEVRQQMLTAGQRYRELKIKENGDELLRSLHPGGLQSKIDQQKLSKIAKDLDVLNARLKVIIDPRPERVAAASEWIQYYRDKIAQLKAGNANAATKAE